MPHAIRSLAAATLVAAGLSIGAQPSAHAAACYHKSGQAVTPAEYARLRPGMTYRQVRDVVGSAGTLMSAPILLRPVQEMYRVWPVCAQDGGAGMFFQRHAGQGIVLVSYGVDWGHS